MDGRGDIAGLVADAVRRSIAEAIGGRSIDGAGDPVARGGNSSCTATAAGAANSSRRSGWTGSSNFSAPHTSSFGSWQSEPRQQLRGKIIEEGNAHTVNF